MIKFKSLHLIKLICLLGFFASTFIFAHEPWLLTQAQIISITKMPRPTVFTHIGWFNFTITILAIIILGVWILFNRVFPYKISINQKQRDLVSLSLRLWTGLMLILLALGLIPKKEISILTEPTLFAPEFFISQIKHANFLKWVEFLIGLGLIFAIYTRLVSLCLFVLWLIGLMSFGISFLQYSGFYLGIIYYLFTQGGGNYSFLEGTKNKNVNTKSFAKSFYLLQLFTGLNFIYSAITIKFLYPNMDIIILNEMRSFTFGLPKDFFVFIMLIVELLFGFLIILGWRLRLISIILLSIFVFMSINVYENLLAHSFIYGILFAFIITNGIPYSLWQK